MSFLVDKFGLDMLYSNKSYSLFINRLTRCPHPKSLSQRGRGTLRADLIISEQAVSQNQILGVYESHN